MSVHMMSDARCLERSYLLTLLKFSNFSSNWRDVTDTLCEASGCCAYVGGGGVPRWILLGEQLQVKVENILLRISRFSE
jgi:hypothetical protein